MTALAAPPQSILPLQVEGLCLDIGGRRLLHEVSMQITAQGITVLLGPNGAGKTLLMETCHGLHQASSGSICWAQPDRSGRERRHTMLAQTPLVLGRSVINNICYALHGQDKTKLRQRAQMALEWAGIESLATRQAARLSLGQQQQLALARAWAMAPELLFLDEPTASLDPETSRRVETLISELAEAGCKILVSTHNLPQAQRLADEILFVAAGRLLLQQPAADFFAGPTCPQARDFVLMERNE